MAIALMMAQWIRGDASLSIAFIVPAFGVICAAALAQRAMPTALHVVNRIDKRTGDDDLLSTAWQLRASTDPWHQTIASLAEVRCLHVRPADMVPRLIGKSGWSAITLSACTLSVLSAMSIVGRGTSSIAASSSDATAIDRQWNQWSKAISVPTSPGMSLPATALEAKAEAGVDSRHAGETSRNPMARPDLAAGVDATSVSTGDSTGMGMGHTAISSPTVANWMQVSEDKTAPITGLGALAEPRRAAAVDLGPRNASDNSGNSAQKNVPNAYRRLVGDYFSRPTK